MSCVHTGQCFSQWVVVIVVVVRTTSISHVFDGKSRLLAVDYLWVEIKHAKVWP